MRPSHFKAEEWLRLSPVDRVKECRRIAEETRELSKSASGKAKRHYIDLALSWDGLADEIEREMKTGQRP